jgi:hypothetical protein
MVGAAVTQSIMWPGEFLSIAELASELGGTRKAALFDAILSAIFRGQFDGHMQWKGSSHPGQSIPDRFDVCFEYVAKDLIAAFDAYGGPEYGGPRFDPPPTSESDKAVALAALPYGIFGEFFRTAYLDRLFLDENVVRKWHKNRTLESVRQATGKTSSTAAAETKCRKGLERLMAANPKNRSKTKDEYFAQAEAEFGVSRRGFDRAWATAIADTGANWDLPGAPKKPRML